MGHESGAIPHAVHPSVKIKQHPEDFLVEELTDVVAGTEGPFALYSMEKQGWSTPDALQALRRRWKIDLHRISYGGLKDRHAHTLQYLSILRGPRRRLTHHDVHVEYLGQVPSPYSSRDIRANRFRLTLRDFTTDALERALAALAEARGTGLPNYFDDQRFGSVSGGGQPSEFVARLLVLGRFEDALREALTAPYAFDRAEQRKEKATLRACWGDWAACKERLPRGHARSLVDYLVHHPSDFRGAVARLRPDLRGLYLSAYQSYLWNRMLAVWLHQHCPPEELLSVDLKLGAVPFPRTLDEAQRAHVSELRLPLASARLHLEENDPHRALVDKILAEEGLELGQLKIKGVRELFFSKGERAGWCAVADLSHETGADEHNPGRRKLILQFELPRGSYATLLVKRLSVS